MIAKLVFGGLPKFRRMFDRKWKDCFRIFTVALKNVEKMTKLLKSSQCRQDFYCAR